MKTTIKTLLALMAGVVAFSACSKDALINENAGKNPDAKPIYSFTAATESDCATRAAIDGLDIKWQSGDAILMMDGINNSKYNLTTGAGTSSGTFSVDEGSTAVSGENIYSLYPYLTSTKHVPDLDEAVAALAVGECAEWPSVNLRDKLEEWKEYIIEEDEESVIREMTEFNIPLENQAIILAYLKNEEIGTPAPELSGSSISNVILPAEQTVADGQTVDPKAVLMVAKAEAENNISFKNVCSYVKVTPTVACKKIVVRANNGEKLAGIFTVSVSDEPSVSSVSEGSNVVTLKAAEGNLAAGTYYIAVLPGILSKGLEVNFYTVEGTLNYNARNTPYTFERNKIHNGGDNNGAVAAYWTQNTYVRDLFGSESVYTNLTSVTINTGVAGSMPAGAEALNNDETVWVRVDGTNAYIETTASRIMATNLETTFMELEKVTNYYNLDKIDVSEAGSVSACFNSNYALLSLDLSSWQISSATSTSYMFAFCNNLSGLTLNNSFHSGDAMFSETGKDSGGCTVFGVTDNAVKADLKNSDITYWDDSYMKFDGE